ncbi:Asp domain containing protein [Pyrenophora tritici-repentis]|uniref:Asp domain containing protein n=2 Tax=Pyrenophora tritici-repentis TaxID=45151 RepID=A0A2W1H6P8_9PLEO|nr:aspergillopepsin A precursor [Pyrenophora tritici-repentis Pt-1C-BFP]KAA8627749.1 Asp domain-containing protein [Pyrenophora tritici-repentis]EDU42201.1 aspergillopepsin A precursor [Pyrenophora tritici-repentis Pt-1C-BFP]KAF7442220.1 Asp domain containing protein [Pyrenophora tritici-repentis]KAF7579416.1 Asp domain containing protein [Pyrenophora tritici-repentis]KAG9378331.1 Asp domain containing protein [Pyrenophora tritici-repentis]
MLSLAQIAAILTFAGAAIANPVPLDEPSSFSIDQAHHTERSVNTALELLRYKRENNEPIPEALIQSAKRSTEEIKAALSTRGLSGSVGAISYNMYDALYLSPMVIGGKTLHVELSTATGEFWVFSSLQPKSQLQDRQFYQVNPAKEKKGYYFDTQYTTEASVVQGRVFTENIKLGDITTVQDIGAANYTGDDLVDMIADGSCGIGFGYTNSVEPQRSLTFFETIMPRLSKRQFSVALRHLCPGSYDFGEFDTKKMASPFVYVPVEDDNEWGAWRFWGDGFAVGSKPVTSRRMLIHLTTSTSVSYTDPDIVADYWKQVQGAKIDEKYGAYVFPCNATNLPDVTFIFSGSRQVIPGKFMNGGVVDRKTKTCYGLLQNIGGGVDFSLLGNNFFKEKYVLHDMNDPKNLRLGFAKLAPSKKW